MNIKIDLKIYIKIFTGRRKNQFVSLGHGNGKLLLKGRQVRDVTLAWQIFVIASIWRFWSSSRAITSRPAISSPYSIVKSAIICNSVFTKRNKKNKSRLCDARCMTTYEINPSVPFMISTLQNANLLSADRRSQPGRSGSKNQVTITCL